MSFSSRFRERREQLGLKQKDVAKRLGITTSAIANYETDVSSPKADILFRVFDVLNCDANYLFQDEMNLKDLPLTLEEQEHIKKYRALDKHGKEIVDFVLDKETTRAEEQRKESEFIPVMMVARNGESGIVMASKDTMKDADLSDTDDL